MPLVPYVVERSGREERVFDIYSRLLKDRARLNEILAKHTGRTMQQVEEETERDRYFDAGQAKEFGLVDDVLLKLVDEKKEKK